MKTLLAGLFVLCASFAVPLRADEGRIPIYQPTTINESGSYLVTRDISVSTGVVITISPPATHVVLDLGGHTLQGPPSADPIILVSSVPSVVIHNGRIQGGFAGIQQGSDYCRLRIENVEIEGSAGPGIRANPLRSIEVEGCHIHDTGDDGMFLLNTLDALDPTFDARIVGNRIERVGSTGLFLEGVRTGEVRRNTLSACGLAGAYVGLVIQPAFSDTTCGGSLIVDNTLSSAVATSGGGIFIGCPRNRIVGNVVRGARAGGIRVISDENRLEGNIVSGNVGHGIEVGDPGFPTLAARNHLEANQAEGNTGGSSCGISFVNGNGHTFRGNIVRGNPLGICGATLGTNTDAGGNIQ